MSDRRKPKPFLCPECGEQTTVGHYVVMPDVLGDFRVVLDKIASSAELGTLAYDVFLTPLSFWTCSKFYDPVTKRRIVP